MIRALYSAASGMTAQQLNVDNIANNLANSNTAGYKARRAQSLHALALRMAEEAIERNHVVTLEPMRSKSPSLWRPRRRHRLT